MFIYRIEHKITGFGPYCSVINEDEVGYILRNRHDDCWGNDAKWPAGMWDFPNIEFYQSKYLFGFDSLKQLTDWFGTDFEILSEYFITIYNIEEENIIKGISKKQIIFDPTKAKIYKYIDKLDKIQWN